MQFITSTHPSSASTQCNLCDDTSLKEKTKGTEDDGVVLFNLGDSNSNTGGVAAVMEILIMPSEGRAYFHHLTRQPFQHVLVFVFTASVYWLRPHHLAGHVHCQLGGGVLGSSDTVLLINGPTCHAEITSHCRLSICLNQFSFLEAKAKTFILLNRCTSPAPRPGYVIGFPSAVGSQMDGVNISYAAPQAHGIVNRPCFFMLRFLPFSLL
jgi:hypothetical protein